MSHHYSGSSAGSAADTVERALAGGGEVRGSGIRSAFGGTQRPPTFAAVLLLVGGVLGLGQLIVPWFTTAKESWTGWSEYYRVSRTGLVEVVTGYSVIIGALAGAAMIIAAVMMLTARSSYRSPLAAGAVAAVVAIACAAWWLVFGELASLEQVTAGWYMFALAGIIGMGGVLVALRVLTVPLVLVASGGLAAIAQLVIPVIAAGDRAGTKTGWEQYYRTAHEGAVEIVAAYGLLVAAIAGAVAVLVAALQFGHRDGATPAWQQSTSLVAGIVISLITAFWLAAGAAPSDVSLAFGFYLLFLAGPLIIFGTLLDRNEHSPAVPSAPGTIPVSPAAALVTLAAGIAGVAQFGLPWFAGASGWRMYYHQPHEGWAETVAAYASLASLLIGAVLLVLGIVAVIKPQVTDAMGKTIGTVTRVAGFAIIAVIAIWMTMGPESFADTVGSGGFGWYLLILTAILALIASATARASVNLTFDKASFMAVFLGVPLIIFVLFVVSPFIQAFYYSMTDWKGFSRDMNFTGFHNYAKLFKDEQFLHAMLNSIELGIVVPLVTIVLGLAVASMVTVGGPSRGPVRGIKASGFYRVISFFPYAVPAIVIGIIWAQVYNPSAGILNSFLTSIGLDGFKGFSWLGERSTAMAASMFVIIWSFVGFYAVLFIASIKGVSAEVYEAAKLDGAGRFRTAISVTIPLIRDTIQTAYIYLGIAALDSFVYMMALNPTGGSGDSTLTMSQDLYLTAFKKSNQFGYGTAMGVILAIVTLLFATLVFAVNRWTGGGKEKVAK